MSADYNVSAAADADDAENLNSRTMTDRHSDWRPSATFDALRVRAETLASLRRFFAERGVLEVETPALSAAAVTDLHLHSVACRLEADEVPDNQRKDLLFSGPFSGSEVQILLYHRGRGWILVDEVRFIPEN